MVCTGTGVAPFRSMIQAVLNEGMPFKQIHLIFGARRESDILYRAEFESWEKSHPNFIYDVALSREEEWPGHRGYVHDIYLDGYKKDDQDVIFMLCGWTRMIDEAVVNLITKMGLDRSQVKYELYG
ncbi:MAG: hypothetical protein IPN29_04070 [Saprospiraceae bacterium]|nr:hypothetical protein [Saprospiraceae bacterium]